MTHEIKHKIKQFLAEHAPEIRHSRVISNQHLCALLGGSLNMRLSTFIVLCRQYPDLLEMVKNLVETNNQNIGDLF